MKIFVYYEDLPGKTKALVVNSGVDEYTIYLNVKNTYEQNIISYRHELAHIENGDYDNDRDVDHVENERHYA